jgi:hypothetical protein
MVGWPCRGQYFPSGGKVTTLTTWLDQVPPGKVVEALGRVSTNSSRDKTRMLKRAAQIQAIAAEMGAKIEVRF